ncbi:multiple organellar RNA editing factor 8, chloroplastic/mitochondrial-like [Rhododendron vialii]|uniref:multiple organellar RNA editing factor 8, chloroplastic/mitochondrial-like n=1 Tax=Rhododendron vialii TaxID=182163 RepID=UPI00265E0B37|nr:multiple organellar RNA editing factor 8, chloroplastic/mitochondrial-like [Rhododendron vialii]
MAARYLLIKAGKLTLSSSHPLLAVKRTSSLSTSSLLRPLIPASSSADIPCFSLAAETVARPSLSPDHDPRRMEFPDRSDFELWRANGLDFEHWQVCLGGFDSGITRGEIVDTCVGKAVTRDDIIDTYVKTLAMVVGSEEEARMKIYSVWTRMFLAFGVLASEELADKIKELPRVILVTPDSYMFPETKDYGGEPFINGQALPFDTKYYLPFSQRSRPRYKKSRNLEVPPNSTKGMQSEGNKVEQDEAES